MVAAVVGLAITLVLILFGIPFAYALGAVGLGGVIYFLDLNTALEQAL